MNKHLEADKKAILSDPLNALSRYHPNRDENDLTALDALEQQRRSLQNNYKDIKDLTKALSQKIGKAKRNNEPVEQLIIAMHEHSAQLKTIKSDLADLERQILDYFEFDNEESTLFEDSTAIDSGRVYTATQSENTNVTISLAGDQLREWNAYVSKNRASSIYHRSEWKELLEKSYGLESYYLTARYDDGTIAGVLPQVRLKSRLFGDYLVSMPYFMRAGAIGDQPEIELKLMQTANDHAGRMGVDHIEYRDDVQRAELPARTDKVHMVLQLPDTPDELWKAFTPKLRSQIRRPQRENSQIHIGRYEYLDDFYSVYARNMRDLGSPVHSKELIRNILTCFPENSWIITLHLDNRPVAAGLLLQHGNRMDIPLASTIRAVNPLGINMLMYWEILKFSIEKRCVQFDFGRSSKDSGTFRFKQQWGARPKQLYLHYWLNEGHEIPSLNPSNPKYATMISLWKRLPVILTRWIGPRIVKNLP